MKRLPSSFFLAATLILLSTAILVLNMGGYLEGIQDTAMRPISGVQAWISLRYSAISDIITSPRDIASLQARNSELESEVARMQNEIINLNERIAEAEILSALLNYARNRPDSNYIAAEVIGSDTSPFLRSIWIGRGSDDGLSFGMPVVTEEGLVGRIVEVRASLARIQLITDPEIAVNVRLQNSRADGVLTAQINGEIWVNLISQDVQIEQDEMVLSSGLGGNYPSDVPVGRVINIRKRDYELFQQVIIEPNVDFENLEIVLVITNFQSLPSILSGE